MATPEEINRVAPFKDRLILHPFDKGHYEWKQIMTYENDSTKIVRVDSDYNADFYGTFLEDAVDPEEKYEVVLGARSVYDLLENRYGLSIVRRDLVIGENPDNPEKHTYFVVSELIEGQNLLERKFNPEEIDDVSDKLSTAYSALINYTWDVYINGGWQVDVYDQDRLRGNNQFVYGRRQDETENRIWLVDVDNKAIYYPPLYGFQFAYLEKIISLIDEVEELHGIVLPKPKERMLDLVRTIQDDDWNYQNALKIRRLLGDSTAPTEEQQEKEVKEIMAQYAPVALELKVDDADFAEMAEDFMRSGHRELDKTLNDFINGTEKHAPAFYDIKDSGLTAQNYNNYARILWDSYMRIKLYQQFVKRMGTEEVERIEKKYGRYDVSLTIQQFINDRLRSSGSVYSALTLNPIFYDLKRQHDMEMISQSGWEDDILPHLDDIATIVGLGSIDFPDRYLTLALSQLGWDYHSRVGIQTIKDMAKQSGLNPENPDDFVNIANELMHDDINEDLSDKMAGVADRFGQETADTLHEMITYREVERLIKEVGF